MDTQKITQELLDTGLTQKELASLVPCSQSLVSAFAKGKRGGRPSKLIGDRLEELHADRCKSRRKTSRKPPTSPNLT